MLLHDSFIQSLNKSINRTHYGIITVAYSPLFHSTFTLIISLFGLLFNSICSIKLWILLLQYRRRKSIKIQEQESAHILSHNKYRFLLVLTSNDCLLCLSSIISCLDERYSSQTLLARLHLCAAHVLVWKFTLHFIPLLTVVILCRYHYNLNKTIQLRPSNLSALKQLLCTDLNILIAFVLALAWSVDGLWLWGVANIKDFIKLPILSSGENTYSNETSGMIATSSTNNSNINRNLSNFNRTLVKTVVQNVDSMFLPQQETICHLQINHNFEFSVRLIHLIQADFILLFSLHVIGLILEFSLHIRLCCCVIIKQVTSTFNHERQLCIYILYIFIIVTLTSLPFYFYRTLEIIYDMQLSSINNDIINSCTFAQILLLGTCFKPLLFFILFFPTSIVFYLKCYLKCYSSTNMQINEQNDQLLSSLNPSNQQREVSSRPPHHRYSLFMRSSHDLKFHSKSRTNSHPILSMNNHHHHHQDLL